MTKTSQEDAGGNPGAEGEPREPQAGIDAAAAPSRGPRLQVRDSRVHGKGVFARRPIRAGERVGEYRGERIDWQEALRRHPHDPAQPNHTFYFSVDDGHVLDGNVGGNLLRWINHACTPNCRAEEVASGGRTRVFAYALRDIAPGEELFYDYGLVVDQRHTARLKRDYACRCGSPDCRGTMLAPKRR